VNEEALAQWGAVAPKKKNKDFKNNYILSGNGIISLRQLLEIGGVLKIFSVCENSVSKTDFFFSEILSSNAIC